MFHKEEARLFSTEVQDGITVLTFCDRAGDLLGMDLAAIEQLWRFFAEEQRNPSKAVVLHAQPSVFSPANMDKLLAAHGISPEGQIDRIFRWEELDFVRAMNAMRDFIEAVRDLEAFVVITLSGRMILPLIGPMLACDYRVASEDFVLINRMTDYAIAPIGGLPWFLTRAVGLKKAEELIREPGEVPGAKAMELGLIEHLAPAEKLLETAVAMAREMAARPEGSKNTLKLASTIGEESLEHYFEREEKMFRKSIARLLAWNGSE